VWPTKDGKRKKPWVRLSKRDGGYLLELESRRLELFDPDRCLKVGRHAGVLGIVYEAKGAKRRVDRDGDERGLVRDRAGRPGSAAPWRGRDPVELAAAAAETALRIAGMSSPPKWLTTAMSAGGKGVDWGSQRTWTDLVDRLQLGLDLEAVKSVMES
jgi:hypothetical protein